MKMAYPINDVLLAMAMKNGIFSQDDDWVGNVKLIALITPNMPYRSLSWSSVSLKWTNQSGDYL